MVLIDCWGERLKKAKEKNEISDFIVFDFNSIGRDKEMHAEQDRGQFYSIQRGNRSDNCLSFKYL